MDPEELFELTGELQGVANAVEGAQLVAIAHAGCHETRLTERGPVEIHHDLGFVDAMTSTRGLAGHRGRSVGRRAQGRAGREPDRPVHRSCSARSSPVSWPPSTRARWSPPATAWTTRRAPPSTTSWWSGWSGWTRPGSPPSPAGSPRGSPPTRSPPPPRKNKQGPGRAGHPRPGRHHRLVGPPPRRALGRRLGRDPRPRPGVRRQGPRPDPGPGPRGRVHGPAADQRHRHRQAHPRHPGHHRPSRPGRPRRRRRLFRVEIAEASSRHRRSSPSESSPWSNLHPSEARSSGTGQGCATTR